MYKLFLFGFALLLMWKNKKFGIVMQHHSFPPVAEKEKEIGAKRIAAE
jgi:hypothetical protein